MAEAGRLLDRLLPPGCAVCGVGVVPGPPLCSICESRLPEIPKPLCRRCGVPATQSRDRDGCDVCDAWPAGLSRAASAVLHAAPADELVRGFKYRGWTGLAPLMGRMMAGPARRLAGDGSTVLVPVPLDRSRQRRRGYNQAALLARELSLVTGLRWESVLRRRSTSGRQAGSGRDDRIQNVRSAFHWFDGPPQRVDSFILVDDVLTTGATAAACSRAISEAGYECRGVVTFARALHRPDET